VKASAPMNARDATRVATLSASSHTDTAREENRGGQDEASDVNPAKGAEMAGSDGTIIVRRLDQQLCLQSVCFHGAPV
jgi:hypothetical protein